ncbi:hypothetical protein [Arthrobacter sp. NPDC090010]|uniref:hypothetical protein n=1 Tax=Arthrobacter sp. NPDC090010 TaxID=3363942 RepID=UPI003821CE8C
MKIFFAVPETSTSEPLLLESEAADYAMAKELMREKILDELETAFGPHETLDDYTWPEQGSRPWHDPHAAPQAASSRRRMWSRMLTVGEQRSVHRKSTVGDD